MSLLLNLNIFHTFLIVFLLSTLNMKLPAGEPLAFKVNAVWNNLIVISVNVKLVRLPTKIKLSINKAAVSLNLKSFYYASKVMRFYQLLIVFLTLVCLRKITLVRSIWERIRLSLIMHSHFPQVRHWRQTSLSILSGFEEINFYIPQNHLFCKITYLARRLFSLFDQRFWHWFDFLRMKVE